MSLDELKTDMAMRHAEIAKDVAPQIRSLAQKHGLGDSAIVEGIIQFIVLAVLIVFVPGILYVCSTGSISIPLNTTYSNASISTQQNVTNGVATVGVLPTIFAIVLIIGVLMLLALRR